MKITNFFSEAYYINVDERTDRRKQIELELIKNKINNFVQRFDAIKPNIKNPENCVKASGHSHRSIIQIAKNKNLNNVLILEDDVIFKNNISDFISSSLNKLSTIDDWDIYYMSANIFDNPLRLVSENLLKIDGCYCIHAYAVNQRAYDRLLKYNPETDIPFDAYITVNSFNKYATYPLVCSQSDGISDNVGGYMSYDSIFENVYSRPTILIQ